MTPLLRRVAATLQGAERVVVVDPPGLAPPTGLQGPGRRVEVVTVRPPRPLHEALVGHGHLDVVVDRARGAGAAPRLPVLLAHVRPGGSAYVALPARPEARGPLLDLVAEIERVRADGVDPPSRRSHDRRPVEVLDLHALAASVAAVEVDDVAVRVVRSDVATWAVVPERRTDDLLAAHPHLGQVLEHRPPASRPRTAGFRSSDPDETGLEGLHAPGLSLRAHDDAVVAPRMVARVRDLVLPQAWRNTVDRRPRTPALAGWTRWSVRVPAELDRPAAPLPGTWFHADNVLRGHFGHAVTEQLSQLWAWPAVLDRYPDAGVLVGTDRAPLAAWETELLEAAGLPRSRVHGIQGPVRVERLLAATPGHVVGRHVHPDLRALHAATGDALEARSGLSATPRRLWVTRTAAKRRCHEEAEVEELARRRGFTVVDPAAHPLPDQVAMVRRAEVVAGWGGSGLVHLLLGGPPRAVVVVTHTGYPAWNEQAAAVLGDHPLTLVRGTPDIVTDGFSRAAMHSDFHLDPDREGRVLREALDGL
ncbi:glycosyltransferase family 61 protein [Nocardioides litoris]|uniref:glycosyltransferase family 61 protein n=1 Tax=Nocardioides litoris TaxID=1926648 RepID=UPI001123ACB3|nr:glycosyltransferase family 61 protein [Nocardioides litoris]